MDARIILLTAAKSDQFAGPLPKSEKPRPAFSYLALGALRGWAADASGKVTASAVVEFARRALALDKGRTQTPELTVGSPGTVLAVGHESAPDLARIDREAAPSAGGGFTVSNLPAVPAAEAPKALDQGSAGGLDFRSVDVEALKKYNAVFESDKGESSAEEKAQAWRSLAKDAPKFADMAEKRAAEWERYAGQRKAADEARQKRLEARDSDWGKLSDLLALAVVPEADKARWSGQFAAAYVQSPGLEPGMARDLALHVPAGPLAGRLKKLASAGKAGIEWVTIPGGSFMMGSEGGEADEKPVHRVSVGTFQMARTEVTNKQYRACVDAGACTPAHASDGTCWLPDKIKGGAKQGNLPRSLQEDDQPVVCVDFDQARAFAQWAGGRLPTEAEWEYAARGAGKAWKYPWGDAAASCERAIMYGGGPNYGCGRDSTWPVCSKPAGNTSQGLCDMAGNVWEWTQDWYHDSYNGAPTDGRAWEDPPGSGRVGRGGSWDDDAANLRAADRDGDDPGRRGGNLGLRPAR